MHALEELLQTIESCHAFESNQRRTSRFPSITPALRYHRCAGGGVVGLQQAKPGLLNQLLVKPRGAKNIVPDGTADRDLCIRDHATNHEGITEHESTSRPDHAKQFTQDVDPARYMAEDIIGKGGVKM